ncbi:hypothetical protein GCM10011529_26330 [Polymorphobacter glacialis]|uniref:Uncharacterized protein n=1 Tax=Sandarakinorhabdus glacialis TaxID=1614636 RepID=A0A917EAN3_9SPHN|nr:hypothetical protein GCM10011529_26330 [Polymorphobacter glacialis]
MPSTGARAPISSIDPANTVSDGNSASSSTSLIESNAHMPRVILRCTEPEKLLACQSVDSRCTRWKASSATFRIMLSVNGTTFHQAIWRSTTIAPPSNAMVANALSAVARPSVPSAKASTSRPASTGTKTSVTVASDIMPAINHARPRCCDQWLKTNANTWRIDAVP